MNLYILKDISDTLWKFYIDKSKFLICDNYYEKVQIDENISEFHVNINYIGTIQLIYITYDGDVKYCEFNKKWTTQTLYTLSNKGDKIQELKVYSLNNELHIFFIFLKEGEKHKGDLLHYKWSGNKFNTSIVASLNFDCSSLKHYDIEILNDEIYIFFLQNEKIENSLNMSKYKKNLWSSTKKLYRLYGSDIQFSTIKKDNVFHILNLTKDNTIYTLEHVSIDEQGNMKAFKVHESSNNICNPLLLIENNSLYTMWVENNSLIYSCFHDNWHKCNNIFVEDINRMQKSRYISEEISNKSLYAKEVFILNSSCVKIFLPEETLIYNDLEEINLDLLQNCDAEKTIQKLLKEISYAKMLNEKLGKRISLLKNKLYEKDVSINNFNNYLNQTISQKKAVEKDYNSLLQSQNNFINELKNIKTKLNLEKDKTDSLKNTILELSQENNKLKGNSIKTKEFENKNCQCNCTYLKDLEFKIKEKENENDTLKEELERFKNMSFFDKIFKIK